VFQSKVYQYSPILFQNLLISIRALIRKKVRETQQTEVLIKEFEENEKDKQQGVIYSNTHLKKQLQNARQNVDFYKTDSNIADTLNSFPLIDKSYIKANPHSFKSKIKPKIIVNGSTGGTTGTPLSIPQSIESVIREQAFISRMLKWAGYIDGDKRAWLRGDMIVPIGQSYAPYWRYSWAENMILLSSYHLTMDTIPVYIKAMVRYGVDIIQAYPSAIVTIAKYLESKNEYYPGVIKSVMTSSESLSTKNRKLIETRFRCKVFDMYGLFERVAMIANCEHGRYHLLTDYSHVEFLDSGDGKHEIVGTNFNNHYYPLIRYKTGDYVVLSKEKTCPCTRSYPIVEEISGRAVDYLVGQFGQKIGSAQLSFVPKGVDGLLECQFIQKASDSIKVLTVVDYDLFNEPQKLKLTDNLKYCLGQDVNVEVQVVSQLTRTKSGKVRHIIREITD